jgi:hypothetical protein
VSHKKPALSDAEGAQKDTSFSHREKIKEIEPQISQIYTVFSRGLRVSAD